MKTASSPVFFKINIAAIRSGYFSTDVQPQAQIYAPSFGCKKGCKYLGFVLLFYARAIIAKVKVNMRGILYCIDLNAWRNCIR